MTIHSEEVDPNRFELPGSFYSFASSATRIVSKANWPRLPRPRALVLGTVVEVGAAHPYFISYGNTLAGGSIRVPTYLSDSNAD